MKKKNKLKVRMVDPHEPPPDPMPAFYEHKTTMSIEEFKKLYPKEYEEYLKKFGNV